MNSSHFPRPCYACPQTISKTERKQCGKENMNIMRMYKCVQAVCMDEYNKVLRVATIISFLCYCTPPRFPNAVFPLCRRAYTHMDSCLPAC